MPATAGLRLPFSSSHLDVPRKNKRGSTSVPSKSEISSSILFSFSTPQYQTFIPSTARAALRLLFAKSGLNNGTVSSTLTSPPSSPGVTSLHFCDSVVWSSPYLGNYLVFIRGRCYVQLINELCILVCRFSIKSHQVEAVFLGPNLYRRKVKSKQGLKLLSGLDEIISLVVGNEPQTTTLSIHKSVLCETSPFFKAACKPEWLKSEDKVIRLPEDNVDAILAMIYWMYQDRIGFTDKQEASYRFEILSESEMDSIWGLWSRLYIIGDKYGIPRLRNHVIDAMFHYRDKVGQLPSLLIPYVYQHTASSDDPLRRLLVAFMKVDLTEAYLVKNEKVLSSEFLFELTMAFVKSYRNGDSYDDVPDDWGCDEICESFHIHDDETRICESLHLPVLLKEAKN